MIEPYPPRDSDYTNSLVDRPEHLYNLEGSESDMSREESCPKCPYYDFPRISLDFACQAGTTLSESHMHHSRMVKSLSVEGIGLLEEPKLRLYLAKSNWFKLLPAGFRSSHMSTRARL